MLVKGDIPMLKLIIARFEDVFSKKCNFPLQSPTIASKSPSPVHDIRWIEDDGRPYVVQILDDGVKFNLALSLHAANDEKRNKIMPINESNSLEALKDAMIYFSEKTGTRPTLEYIIFKDFNDEILDAKELVQFVKSFPSKVNIIEYNSIDNGKYQQADPLKVDAFADYLESKKVIVNIRRSRGKDIDAACGQLANKNELANQFFSTYFQK